MVGEPVGDMLKTLFKHPFKFLFVFFTVVSFFGVVSCGLVKKSPHKRPYHGGMQVLKNRLDMQYDASGKQLPVNKPVDQKIVNNDKSKVVVNQEKPSKVKDSHKKSKLKMVKNAQTNILAINYIAEKEQSPTVPITQVEALPTSDLPKLKNSHFHALGKKSNAQSVMFINSVSKEGTATDYYNRYFSNFEVLGKSLFVSDKDISPNNFKEFAYSKFSNIVIVKKQHKPNSDSFYYDVLYLKGDTTAPTELFNDLGYQGVTPQAHASTARHAYEDYNLYSRAGLGKTQKNSAKALYNLIPMKRIVYNYSVLEQPLSPVYEVAGNCVAAMWWNIKPTQLTSYTIDRSTDALKMARRFEKLVGYWVDPYDKTIIGITYVKPNSFNPEPSTLAAAKKNPALAPFIPVSTVYYKAYVVLPDHKKVAKYNKRNYLNKAWLWYNGDCKLSFQSGNPSGTLVDVNKMVVPVNIRIFPAKGYIQVTRLDTNETRYLLPLNSGVSKRYIAKLYGNLHSRIPPDYASEDTERIGLPVSNSLTTVVFTLLIGTVAFF